MKSDFTKTDNIISATNTQTTDTLAKFSSEDSRPSVQSTFSIAIVLNIVC